MSDKDLPTTTKASTELLRKLIFELQFNPAAERYYNTCLQRERRTTAASRRTTVRELLVRYSGRILGHEISPTNSSKQLARNGIDVVALEHIRRALDTAWKMPYVEPHQGSGYDLSDVPDIDWAAPAQAISQDFSALELRTIAADIEHTKVDAILSALHGCPALTKFYSEEYQRAGAGVGHEGVVLKQPGAHWFKTLSDLRPGDLVKLTEMNTATTCALGAVAMGIAALQKSLETPFQTYLKEITMRTIPAIEVTTRTFVNGIDISTMSKADIYGLIRDQEKHIEELKAIQNKPASLQREITQRQESIQALVDYLNKQDPVQAMVGSLSGPAYATPARDIPAPREA